MTCFANCPPCAGCEELRRRAEAAEKKAVEMERIAIDNGAVGQAAIALAQERLERIGRLGGALREMHEWFYWQGEEGQIGYYDRIAMQFYRETGIWPPGKSAPVEMHHELNEDARHVEFGKWNRKRYQEIGARAVVALSSPAPETAPAERFMALQAHSDALVAEVHRAWGALSIEDRDRARIANRLRGAPETKDKDR